MNTANIDDLILGCGQPGGKSGFNDIGSVVAFLLSAAGLLTMIGSAPYSVTKHAATRMFDAAGPLQEPLSHDTPLTPERVAEKVWQALQHNRFLALPHPQVRDYYTRRAADTDRWLGGMRKLQRRLNEGGFGG